MGFRGSAAAHQRRRGIIHGLNDTTLLAAALNGTWDFVERDLTITTVPGAGQFVQPDEPDLVTKTLRAWLLR